jgi:hypothetical protein
MIKLDKNYTLISDPYNWILRFEEVKEGKDKEGNLKEIISTKETYHANIKQAIMKYVDESLKNIPELALIIEKLESIEESLNGLKV